MTLSDTTGRTGFRSKTTIGDYTFRIYIQREEFLRRVDPCHPLRKIVHNATAIVSPRDISHLMGANSAGISIEDMHRCDIENLFSRVQDSDGVHVYRNAKISDGRISPSMVYHGQTFVQADKIVGLGGLNRIFDHIINPGISKMGAKVMTYEGKDVKYVAIYLPVIVEYMSKELILPVLQNLKERIKTSPTVQLQSFENGRSGLVDFRRIAEETEELLGRSNIMMLPILRDGTHRSHTTNIAGTTMEAVIINGTGAIPTGIPIRPSEMVVTVEKPEKMEDRYPGYLKKSWMNYKDLGIDG
jgi:hypothetical protein